MPTRWKARELWRRIAIGLICLCGAAAWAEAKSSSQTIGVQIIVPERPSLPTDASSVSSRPEDFPAPLDGCLMERTTTLIRNGKSVTIRFTTTPSF